MLLEHGELGAEPAGFPDVRGLRQPVVRAQHITARAQSREALPSGQRIGRLRLQPVNHAEAQLPGRLEVLAPLDRRHPAERPEMVFIRMPDRDGHIAGEGAEPKLSRHSSRRENTPRARHVGTGPDRSAEVIQPRAEKVGQDELRVGTARTLCPAPEIVVPRARDHVLLARSVIKREHVGEHHLLARVGRSFERQGLTRLGARLGPDHRLDFPEFQDVAELGAVEDVRRTEGAECW